jgi:hypothetical protein
MKTKTETKTETKHTPGPWRVSEGMTPDTLLVRDDEHGIAQVWAAYRPDGPLEVGTKEANARLIAAAPELLEELRNCVRHNADILDNCLFPAHGLKANLTPEQALWREKIKKWNTETRAAIAKATGQN